MPVLTRPAVISRTVRRLHRRDPTALEALRLARSTRKLLVVEYKNHQVGLSAAPNSTGAVQHMTTIAEGDDHDDRSGRKIRLKYAEIRGTVQLHASATDSRVRLTLVRDNSGTTTAPSFTDLFASAALHLENRPKIGDAQSNARFTILMDKYIIINTNNLTKAFKWSKSLDMYVTFTGASATNEGKGCLYIFATSNEATNDPVLAASMHMYFIDN